MRKLDWHIMPWILVSESLGSVLDRADHGRLSTQLSVSYFLVLQLTKVTEPIWAMREFSTDRVHKLTGQANLE